MKARALGYLVAILVGVLVVCPTGKLYAAESIVIGVPTSLTFLEGEESLNCVRLAVDEINAQGGVQVGDKKMPLEIESIDIRDAAPGVPVPEALLGIEKIILEKKVNALVVGPFRSEALLAAMDIIAKYKVPMLGTIAVAPTSEAKLMENPEKYKYIFRTCLNGKYLVGYLIGGMKFLNQEFGFNKVFVMNQDVAWARGVAKAMIDNFFQKTGWTVLGQEIYPTGSSDFSAGLMKVRATGAQVILNIFDMPQSGILVKQWKSMKVPAIIAGFNSPLAGPGAWKTFDGQIGGALNSIFEIGNIPTEKYAPAKDFYYAYEKKYGKPIEAGHGPAPSYESVYLLAEAITRAGSLDPDKIVEALKATDRQGVMGRIKFSESNQVLYGADPQAEALGCVYQWTEDGKRVIVYPPSLEEGKIVLPSFVTPAKQ
ncbi:MAG: ABC transporter substrate-binding protein [Deltaproteobacteria bacterium]|nr:ABC transporter substrate-binding protein [Deltaproteobacteria bacterium]